MEFASCRIRLIFYSENVFLYLLCIRLWAFLCNAALSENYINRLLETLKYGVCFCVQTLSSFSKQLRFISSFLQLSVDTGHNILLYWSKSSLQLVRFDSLRFRFVPLAWAWAYQTWYATGFITIFTTDYTHLKTIKLQLIYVIAKINRHWSTVTRRSLHGAFLLSHVPDQSINQSTVWFYVRFYDFKAISIMTAIYQLSKRDWKGFIACWQRNFIGV